MILHSWVKICNSRFWFALWFGLYVPSVALQVFFYCQTSRFGWYLYHRLCISLVTSHVEPPNSNSNHDLFQMTHFSSVYPTLDSTSSTSFNPRPTPNPPTERSSVAFIYRLPDFAQTPTPYEATSITDSCKNLKRSLQYPIRIATFPRLMSGGG